MSAPSLRATSLAVSARVAAAAEGGPEASSGSGLAVVDGSTRWSWRDLDSHADGVARQLIASGAGPGDRIALLAAPSAASIATLHGIARIGGVVAPLAATLSSPEIAAAGAVIRPRMVVCGEGLEGPAHALADRVVELADLVGGEPASRPVAVPVAEERVPDPESPAVVILTSGTTDRPKAAVLSARALAASAEAWLTALPPASGWLLALGLSHIAGIGVVWRAALSGVPLVVLDRPDAGAIVAALAAHPAPSHVSLVPTLLARILDATSDAAPPATLRAVPLGGGPIAADLVLRALRAGWPIVPTYGLTEAGSGVAALPTSDAAEHPASAGRALPGVDLRIAAPDTDQIGEIQVRSPALFTGYLDDPVASHDALTPDGWLRTGDLGRLDGDGRLTVVDRRTDRIVRGGENIAPAEVEAVLIGHPAISDAGVVARRDPTYGHVPVAAVVLRGGVPDPGDDAFAVYCRDRLASFKVPVAFARLPALPRSDAGKLRRSELRERLDRPDGADAWPSTPHDRRVAGPDGKGLAYRSVGQGPRHVLLLHATLSSAGQLTGLARHLAADGRWTVHAVDRRGSGASRLATPLPLDVAVHVEDLVAVLDAEGVQAAVLVGVSYGGVVALEFAARRPGRALAVVAFEPPYGPVANAATRQAFAMVAADTERAQASGGTAAAAEAFMAGVAGPEAWRRLSARTRGSLAEEGGSAVVDAGLRGLDADGLGRIRVPVVILTGDASAPFYREIATALAHRIPGAEQVRLAGLAHTAPMTDPGVVGDAILRWLAEFAGDSATAAPHHLAAVSGHGDEAR